LHLAVEVDLEGLGLRVPVDLGDVDRGRASPARTVSETSRTWRSGLYRRLLSSDQKSGTLPRVWM
jgi:hypothetical protein